MRMDGLQKPTMTDLAGLMSSLRRGNFSVCMFDGAHEKTRVFALLKSDKSVTNVDESTGEKNRCRQAIRSCD
jgi:hypothetical protein